MSGRASSVISTKAVPTRHSIHNPVGKVLEQISRLNKLGPPLLPTSEMPHPAAGRCIKCHDIVIKVPLDKTRSKMLWVL